MKTFSSRIVLVSVAAAVAACGPPGLPPAPASVATARPAARPAPPAPVDLSAGYRTVLGARDIEGQLVGPLPAGKQATIFVMFASWCGPCRHELAILSELRAERPELRVIGINAYEEWGDMSDEVRLREFIAANAPWLQVVRADDALMKALGSPPKIPTLFVFDRAGGLVQAFLRARRHPPDKDELAAVVTAAIGAGHPARASGSPGQ